ncbi:phage portal protein [Gordonia sp. DT219]|uniref:phage portal protein n=1 Tax=Gordonia sp. DT219 TaxID=3416658 RepID=UPI003CE9FED7
MRTTVSFLARNIAQLGIHAFRRKGDTDRERLDRDHPLSRVMLQPSEVVTRYRLMDALVHDLAIFDRAYWLKIGSAAQPAVVRIPPTLVTPKGDNWISPAVFEVKGAKGKREFPADRLVYFRGYGGVDDFGTSPLEALRQILAEENAGSKARTEVLRNGARVSGYLERPADAKPWSAEARGRFKRGWQAQYAGDGPQAGGTPILEDGMKFTAAAQSAKDLQYLEVRKLTREEVASVYHVPPPMVGILDKATFSNITEQHKMLYQDTLGPWLQMFAEEISLQLIPDIAPGEVDELYVEFNLREKLSGSFEERAAQMQTSVGGPWMTINEARALDNRPPIDGGDELIKPLNLTQNGDKEPIPAGDDGKEPSPPPVDDGADDDQEDVA